ncbi:MAG: GxxExxY protein [Parachlamydiaceae bacterium]|nr:GxxExxY protein [Parachlamydiaceae bacterium]
MEKVGEDDRLTYEIIGAAIEVHRYLGPGLLESVYEECFVQELRFRKLKVEQQYALPIIYKGIKLNADFRLDLLVEEEVIIELKSVKEIMQVHEAQLLTYLKLLGRGKGLLINFNVAVLKEGVRRFKI